MSIPRSIQYSWPVLCLLLWSASCAATNDYSHAKWDALLREHVRWREDGAASRVDYAGFERDRDRLRGYLERLSAVPAERYRRWSQPERMAFLINAYNAWTIELILGAERRPASIRDLGSWLRSPWKRRFFDLLGVRRSLDEVEHTLLRRDEGYADPRIHFAVNCASIGCPALRPEAYTGDALEQQLEDQTRRFLADRSRNGLSDDGSEVRVSSIFDWYAEDFERDWRGSASVRQFLARYSEALGLTASQTDALRDGSMRLRFGDYDWRLNDRY